MSLDDHQLSREREIRWIRGALPPFITYCRELVWDQPWFPSPRCLAFAEVIAFSVCRDTNAALRVFYLLTDTDSHDGWHPVPPGDDPHGGALTLTSSIGAGKIPQPFIPTINDAELAKWRAKREPMVQYWERFKALNPVQSWDRLTGVVLPEPPKPKGLMARLWGAS